MGDLNTWISDKLISLLGFSKPVIVQFVISLSHNASSPGEIVKQLVDLGASSSDETSVFADEIFSRVERKKTPAPNMYLQREREAAMLARKQKASAILGEDGLDADDDSIPKIRIKNFRKRVVQNDVDDELVTNRGRESRVRRRISNDVDDGAESEEERVRDQIEKEELECRIRDRDAERTRKVTDRKSKKKEEKQAVRRSSNSIETLRKVSRQEYLKKREQKKLDKLRDDINDEEYLFEGVKLSKAEYDELRHKKEVYKLVKKRAELYDHTDEYRMPEAYDQQGCVNQDKRFAVALQSYRDAAIEGKTNRFSEQHAWEEHQIDKAIFQFGSKDKMGGKRDDFEFLFDDLNNAAAMHCSSVEKELSDSGAKRAVEKLQNKRETLPIYSYKDDLLQAINDHQVLVIVGETGCGKTTQLPQYLHEAGYTQRGMIACTQPRRVAAMSVAARVSQEMGVKLGHEVGYSIRFEDCTSEKTLLKYMTDGMLLRELLINPRLEGYSVIMVDEAHERTVSTDILFALVKDIVRASPDLKLLISSATLDAEKFSSYFDNAPIFKVPGRKFPVEIFYAKAPEPDYLDAAIVTVLQIHVMEPPGEGDILVFLSGQEEIEAAQEILEHRTRKLGTKIAELIICPIYANLPTELQVKALELTHEGARKVVLATNIAETSLTIDGIKYVIDPGFAKMKSYSPRTGMESLLVTPISKASADQRAGRSGRTGPGKCFRLYTEENFLELEDNTIPEIQRINLSNVVLILKSLGIENVLQFDFMDPPLSEAVLKSLEELHALGALNKFGELTKVGRIMSEFPLDPMLSKMIVASDKYKCSGEIILIAAMLSVGNSIFYHPKGKQQVYANNARQTFHMGNVGDHIALLRVYTSWKKANFSTQWCYENYIQARSMKRARDIRGQLEGLLERVGIHLTSNPNDLDAIKKAIMSGFFLHSARLQDFGAYMTIKNPRIVNIHPSSGLAEELPRWIIYHELVLTTKEFMRQVTEVKPEWLVEIAPHCYQMKDVEDPRPKKMPRGMRRAYKG